MRRNSRLIACLAALAVLTLAATYTPVRAETLTALVQISPLNEVPPITGLNATGGFQITVEVTRDPNGNITSGKVTFLGIVQFPGAVTITGLHIHEGDATVNGPVRFGTDISGSNTIMLPSGVGIIGPKDAVTVDPVVLGRFLANPSGFYVNLHTTVNPGGAMRGQHAKLTETVANTVNMTTAQEVPPTTVMASAVATITVNPTRNAQGQVTGGNINFAVAFDFPANITFTGLHIHEQVAGMNGPVRFDTRITGGNPLVSATGKGFININVPVITADQIAAFNRMLANPAGFYVNLHTTVNPGGAVRGQLTGLGAAPAIAQANKYFLATGMANETVAILATGADPLTSTVLINGQQVQALIDINTGNVNVTVPAALLANPGLLVMQVRNANGQLSAPLTLVVAAQASLNAQPVATVEAAGFSRTSVSAESIVAGFGTRLASQTVSNTPGQPLPTSLDGTMVYVNGIPAQLVFVSANQVNYVIPEGTVAGPAAVVAVARDGTVSQGQVLVTNVAPGIFTRTANGLGAPAAVASADGGATFPISLSNADGTPVEIQAGNIVAFFGTGLRFVSRNMTTGPVITATAGGVTSTPSFVGAQGQFTGLDQINWTVPQGLAGRGEVDLTFTVDGRMTNPVRIKVR